jgi:Predicted transcriptional regulators
MKENKPLKKLIQARKGMGLNQEEFAKRAKISRPMLSHIERGASLPSLPVAYRIAKAANKSIEELFFDKNARKMSIKGA